VGYSCIDEGLLDDNISNTETKDLYEPISSFNNKIILKDANNSYKKSAHVIASSLVTIQNITISKNSDTDRTKLIYDINQIQNDDTLYRSVNALKINDINSHRKNIIGASNKINEENKTNLENISNIESKNIKPTYYNTPIDEGTYHDNGLIIEDNVTKLNIKTSHTSSDLTRKAGIMASISAIIESINVSHDNTSFLIDKFVSQTSKQMEYNINMMDLLSTDDSDNLLSVIEGVGVALSVLNLLKNPNQTLKSIFNVLSTPLENAMLLVNELICAIKQVLCLAASTVSLAKNMVETFSNAFNDFEQAKTLQKIQDFWDNINNKIDSITDDYIESLKNAIRTIANKNKGKIVKDLHDNNFYGSDWGDMYSKSVEDTINELYPTLMENLSKAFKTEFNKAIDSIKLSVDHTTNLLLNVTDAMKCTRQFDGVFDVNIVFPYISLSDLSLDIPAVNSRIVKC